MTAGNAKFVRVRELLLAHSARPDNFWPWLQELNGRPADMKSANKFLVASTIDYQQDSEKAWANVRRWAEETMGDPPDLLSRISSYTADEWQAKRTEYGLHRYGAGHRRVRDISVRVVIQFAGDARRIWAGQAPMVVLGRLEGLGIGPQISRMLVGALIDTGQISGATADVKADIHVRRVIGRVFRGHEVDEDTATRLTRLVSPENPWELDLPLYQLGQGHCRPTAPRCAECYLRPECLFARKAR